MEPERECNDEEETDERKLEEGLHHVREHDHVDPQEGEFSNILELSRKICCFRFHSHKSISVHSSGLLHIFVYYYMQHAVAMLFKARNSAK